MRYCYDCGERIEPDDAGGAVCGCPVERDHVEDARAWVATIGMPQARREYEQRLLREPCDEWLVALVETLNREQATVARLRRLMEAGVTRI